MRPRGGTKTSKERTTNTKMDRRTRHEDTAPGAPGALGATRSFGRGRSVTAVGWSRVIWKARVTGYMLFRLRYRMHCRDHQSTVQYKPLNYPSYRTIRSDQG